MPYCKDCALFDDCMADENDTPENFDCTDFTPKEGAEQEQVTEEAEELWGEETLMEEEFEGFDESGTETEPEPEPEPKPKPKPKTKPKEKAKAKSKPKPKTEPKPKTIPVKEEPKEELKKESEYGNLENKIRSLIKEREDIMVIKVKFLVELANTNPNLKKDMIMDNFLDKLVDLVTTAEATKIVSMV